MICCKWIDAVLKEALAFMNEQQRLEQRALLGFPEDACPAAEQLAAYALGYLQETSQLRVAAHVRACPRCLYLVAVARPPKPRARWSIARPVPFVPADGLRGEVAQTSTLHYQAGTLFIRLTIPPPSGDTWRLVGRLSDNQTPVVNSTVRLKAGRRVYDQQSDAHGFFAFSALLAGRYTLWVAHDTRHVQVRGITLGFV